MGLSLETLDEYTEKIDTWIGKLETRAADLWLEIYEAERELKETHARVWMQKSDAIVKGKAPSQKWVDYATENDPRVQAAHLKYARLEHKKRKVEAQLRRIRSIDNKIPGIQGKQNALMQNR